MARYLRGSDYAVFAVKVILLVFLFVIVLFPFYWILVSSFKPTDELIRAIPTFIPETFTVEHYKNLLRVAEYPSYLYNSIVVGLLTTLLSTFLVFLGGYSIYRCEYPGKNIISSFVIASYAVPTTLLTVPLYLIFAGLGLINNLLSLVLINVTLVSPLGVWLLKAFLSSIPREVEEAALVDGAGRLRIMFQLVLPLIAPGIGAVAIFCFITSWTEFLFANIFMLDEFKKTLPVGIARFITQYNVDWGLLMAGAVLTAIPPVILFALFGKSFVRGLTAGATKY
ncbi:carbohydrate ABC transporter permease [Thermatribacter velox]|uniref:Maltose/maltodextrin transport system permease protein MalG n=1 Tax=Thermatribacter velox TaxID=3039681 RepID=A0ABZ2Y8W2_9BACT